MEQNTSGDTPATESAELREPVLIQKTVIHKVAMREYIISFIVYAALTAGMIALTIFPFLGFISALGMSGTTDPLAQLVGKFIVLFYLPFNLGMAIFFTCYLLKHIFHFRVGYKFFILATVGIGILSFFLILLILFSS